MYMYARAGCFHVHVSIMSVFRYSHHTIKLQDNGFSVNYDIVFTIYQPHYNRMYVFPPNVLTNIYPWTPDIWFKSDIKMVDPQL